MTGNSKIGIAVIAVLALIGGVLGYSHHASASAASSQCYAGPNEKCPDADWLQGWNQIEAFQKKYAAPQDEQDRIAGVSLRLQKTAPVGYNWDPKVRKFIQPPQIVPTSPAK